MPAAPEPRRPIRVLFTIPNLDTAGSGRAMARIIEGLDPEQFETAICVDRRGGSLKSELEAQGREVLINQLRMPVRPWPTLPGRLQRAAEPLRGRFDIWHSFDYRDDYSEALIARRAGARWVYTKKNMSWNHRSWWARTVLASGVAVQNHDMLSDFFVGPLLSRHAHYIPRGIELPAPAEPATRAAWRQRIGVAADTPLVACVAQLIPRKGQLLLVEALSLLPDVHVALAGAINNQGYADQVRAAAARAGAGERVHWLGHVGDVAGLLAASDVFCLPTGEQAEGCPVALLEAMAAGIASLATDVPGSRDVVIDRVNGRLVPRDDAAALAGALGDLFADPVQRDAIAAAGRQRVADSFSLEAEVANHAALYRTIFAGGRPAR